MCGIGGKLYFDPARLVERDVLERRGHGFRSRCDTEVILHLQEEHGTDYLRFLQDPVVEVWPDPAGTAEYLTCGYVPSYRPSLGVREGLRRTVVWFKEHEC